MAKRQIDKIASKRQSLISRTAEALDVSPDEATALLNIGRHQSLRINPLRSDEKLITEELNKMGVLGKQYGWCPEGYELAVPVDEVRDLEAVTDGQVFIQNAASWLPVIALDPKAEEDILDVCAAPGGKTSHIAARTHNQAHIWANDNSRARLAKLQSNVERLGANIDQYALFDATTLAKKLDHQFDKILLDAPCSGEGLMRLDRDKDFTTWSVAHIRRLQQLQKKILGQAWQLLKPGGTLVYSTCTMAPEENEAVVDYMLRSREDSTIVPIDLVLPNRVPTVRSWNGKEYAPEVQGCMRLTPGKNIEAFFVCAFKKVGTTE